MQCTEDLKPCFQTQRSNAWHGFSSQLAMPNPIQGLEDHLPVLSLQRPVMLRQLCWMPPLQWFLKGPLLPPQLALFLDLRQPLPLRRPLPLPVQVALLLHHPLPLLLSFPDLHPALHLLWMLVHQRLQLLLHHLDLTWHEQTALEHVLGVLLKGKAPLAALGQHTAPSQRLLQQHTGSARKMALPPCTALPATSKKIGAEENRRGNTTYPKHNASSFIKSISILISISKADGTLLKTNNTFSLVPALLFSWWPGLLSLGPALLSLPASLGTNRRHSKGFRPLGRLGVSWRPTDTCP